MSNKAYFEQEIRDRANELDSLDDALSIGLLSLSSYSSSARATMLSSHLMQCLVPIHAEIPGVLTGYEHMFGQYSTGYKKTDSKIKIVKKIEKYPGFSYTLITYDPKKDEYGILQRQEVRNLSEMYGYKWNNEVIDSYSVGDTVPKDTVMYRSPSFDEYQNYRYGVNAKVVYVISQETIEDAVVVSESFAKKMATTYVDTCDVPINDNDIPLNIYGNSETYKSFPDIGEKTKKAVICAVRRKNKAMDQFNLKNSNLRKIFPSDDVYQMSDNFAIADIDIWSNKSIDDIPDLPAYAQVKRYMRRLIEYYTEIYEEFQKIINSDSKYTEELSRLYSKAKDYLDPTCKYADEDKIFSNIQMEFTMYKIEKLRRGCKIAGRYGNKSVLSNVISDEEMGCTEDGVVPDIRIDALGVLGRLNSGQLYEMELNWIAETVRDRISRMDSLSEKFKYLYSFLDIAAPEQAASMREYLAYKSNDEVIDFMKKIEDGRIYIIQSPMYCVNGDTMVKLYDKFNPERTYMTYTNEDGERHKTIKKVIVADEYIMRLKQEPVTKFSVRSKSMNNPRTSMPIKSTKAARHKIPYPDQCNRLGEQELNILMLSADYDALDYFLRSHASSTEGRRASDLFEDDPTDGFIINMPSEKSRAVDMLNTYLKTMGYKLNITYDKNSKKNIKADCDIPTIPDYIKKML